MIRSSRTPFSTAGWLVALLVSACAGFTVLAMPQAPAAPAGLPAPIDPQIVRDQDDMTWDDYKPIPGTTWNDPARVATVKTIRIAIVCADFPDVPFVMTLPKKSDLYGNPQIDPVKREDIAKFYLDFWTKPQEINHGHTIQEYWMEQSRGKIGVAVRAFGAYKMPGKSYQYGFSGGMNGSPAQSMPFDEQPNPNMTRDLDALWAADAGPNIRSEFDLVLRLYAGYDESAVWQEFGEMKFQTKDDIPAEWGNPDSSKPRWAKTRYIDWTSWNAASWLWSNSAIITGEGSGAIRHEVSHAAFKVGDNYNNPYVQPYRRVGSGPWDLMDRGSFNGPGGPHKRYLVPKTEGDAMSAGLMLRQRVNFNFVTKDQVLTVNRYGLAASGLVVANVTARAIDPVPPSLSGIVVRLDGDPNDPAKPHDLTPVDNPVVNPLSSGIPDYDFYSMEVVQRMGYDSCEPDSGVLLAKNKDGERTTGGPNGFRVFDWVIDAHPEDINKLDFKRPHGEPVMRTIADYRQLNDALFHAGLNSGSQFEWEDTPNRLHFYVVDVQHDAKGVLSYTVGVRSLDGAGTQARGGELTAPTAAPAAAAPAMFKLKNTGATLTAPATTHPSDATPYLANDIYRLNVTVDGDGWSAALVNALAALKVGATQEIPVYVAHASTSAKSAKITLTATSESDPSKTTSVTYTIKQ